MKKNENETEILLVHKFYWVWSNHVKEIYKNIFMFLLGSESNKMKIEQMRMKHKFY